MKSLTTLAIRYSLTRLAGMANRKRLLVNVLATVFVCAGPMMDSRSHGQDQDAPAPAQIKFLKGDDVGGGAFTPSSVNGKTIWVETSDKNPDDKHTFTEAARNNDYITVFDATRNLYLGLPLAGGMCKFSEDAGTNWNDLCKLSVVALNRPAVTDEPQSEPAPKPKLKEVAIYPWGKDPQPLSQLSTELITIKTTQVSILDLKQA